MHADYKLIGSRIKKARKINDLTQDQLAEKLNVSIGYVSQVERGITKISIDLLSEISEILNCDLGELITGTAKQSADYLEDDIMIEYRKLSEKERNLVYEFIKWIQKNHLTESDDNKFL